MLKLKICGMRRPEDMEIANKYKPDYIGFVFAVYLATASLISLFSIIFLIIFFKIFFECFLN